ncbi:MAG: FAD-binding oxidoreductase, partial [Verrucomicrobia bacterium]|nr:FAD-binding oxidoreductase [Verrucomicrobiota bacterium]
MNKVLLTALLSLLSVLSPCPAGIDINHPTKKVTIIGGGIAGTLEAYYAYLDAKREGVKVRITVYDKNRPFAQSHPSTNTGFNIVPSLTVDEILSVVPRGQEMSKKLSILFSEPGGIRIDDVPGLNDSEAAIRFKEAVALYGMDKHHGDRTEALLNLGKVSMQLWQ